MILEIRLKTDLCNSKNAVKAVFYGVIVGNLYVRYILIYIYINLVIR